MPIVDSFVHIHEEKKPLTFVAGSSWLPDEAIFIEYFNTHPSWKLIIAPHVIGEDHLKQIISLLKNKKVVRYTQTTETDAANADVLIIDCFGLLSSIYRYGEVAYVGGGFGVGIHNVLEAAVWSIPVIFGPNNAHFAEAQGLKHNGGGFEIHNLEDFSKYIQRFEVETNFRLERGIAGGKYVAALAGASNKVLNNIQL